MQREVRGMAIALPPVENARALHSRFCQRCFISQRSVHARRVRLLQTTQRRLIQVVVMVVAEQHDVDGRQLIEINARTAEAFGTGKLHRAGAFRPNRVGEDVHAGSLNEHGRVVHESREQARPFNGRGRQRGVGPRFIFPLGVIAGKHPAQQRSEAPLRRNIGSEEPFSIEVIAARKSHECSLDVAAGNL
jgi:hypothetical protein